MVLLVDIATTQKRSVPSRGSMDAFLLQQKQSKGAEVAPDVAILSARVALKMRPCEAESVVNANFKIFSDTWFFSLTSLRPKSGVFLPWEAWMHFCFSKSNQKRRKWHQMSPFLSQGLPSKCVRARRRIGVEREFQDLNDTWFPFLTSASC